MSASFHDDHGAQCERCEAMTLDEVCSVLRDLGEAESRDMLMAFARAEVGTYGYCVDCHREIDRERLSASGFAERCTPCERALARLTVRGAA